MQKMRSAANLRNAAVAPDRGPCQMKPNQHKISKNQAGSDRHGRMASWIGSPCRRGSLAIRGALYKDFPGRWAPWRLFFQRPLEAYLSLGRPRPFKAHTSTPLAAFGDAFHLTTFDLRQLGQSSPRGDPEPTVWGGGPGGSPTPYGMHRGVGSTLRHKRVLCISGGSWTSDPPLCAFLWSHDIN